MPTDIEGRELTMAVLEMSRRPASASVACFPARRFAQGLSLTVNFGHNTGVHFNVPADAGTPSQVVRVDEDFLTVVQEWSDGPRERRYLWEDVSGVECITRKPG